MKKFSITIISILGFMFIFFLLSPTIQNAYWSFREFLEPRVNDRIEKEWRNKPAEFLLHKLTRKVRMYSGTAAMIIVERKEKRAIPEFLKLIKSPNEQTRISAFIALGEIGDERAIEPLMEIIKEGRANKDFLSAIDALSIMHYEPIYPEILQMAKDNYHTSWVVDMLERFPEKPETLPALKNISKSDPEGYIRDKANRAIASL